MAQNLVTEKQQRNYKEAINKMVTWKKIKINDKYQISSEGDVCSFNYHSKGKLLKPTCRGNTWKCVILCCGNNKKAYSVAQLVYETFVGPIPKGHTVMNKDGDIHNNKVSNLILVKRSDKIFIKARKKAISSNENKSYYRYQYYKTNSGTKELIGGTREFLDKYTNQSRQNIDQRFAVWEKRIKSNNPLANPQGLLFGDDYIIREKVMFNIKHESRIDECEAKYGIVIRKR